MKTKKVEKVNAIPGVQTDYIQETLKFIESDEMRSHLQKWFDSGSVGHTADACAEIVFHAPVSLEQKLPLLELLSKHEEGRNSYAKMYLQDAQKALDERYNSSMEYGLYLYGYGDADGYDENTIMFKSFDEAVKHIKSLDKQVDINDHLLHSKDLTLDNFVFRARALGQEHSIIYAIEQYPLGETSVCWYLNDAGELLYSDYYTDQFPGGLRIPAPFAPGDIVMTDCRPFGDEKKVLILENSNPFDYWDGSGVTCLFINKYDNIDAGYFKNSEFVMDCKYSRYVSGFYRAKTFTGELEEDEAPLEVIRKAIKDNPKLGHDIFRYVDEIKRSTKILADFPGEFGEYFSKLKYTGVPLKLLKKEFGL